MALIAGAFCGGQVAFSGKPTEHVSLPQLPSRTICDTRASKQLTHKLIDQAIAARVWTQKDHQQITPIFNSLRNQEKIEIIQKIAAAVEKKQLRIEKGARLF